MLLFSFAGLLLFRVDDDKLLELLSDHRRRTKPQASDWASALHAIFSEHETVFDRNILSVGLRQQR